ncbi:MAG: CoA transferase subunit A [Deltaproteobacteria bacterium]|nr:CoA transferase subunit A [Deltaproteobacteria bacterium]MCW5807245.1 CoA transferase subunit A [Deltaproteobacteria bacterium]
MSGRHSDKVHASIREALEPLRDGMTVLVGGFGLSGNPEALIRGVVDKGARDLTLVSNNAGNLGKGLAQWLRAGLIKKVICSYIGNNEDLHTRMASGEVKVEITPQGTLAERMRAAGAGIPAFYTPTGVGTVVEEGKETKEIDGRRYVLERALPGDLALVRASVADRFGNARFWRTGRNFNPVMATAAKTTILECDRLVDNGAIDPDDAHLHGIFVHRIIHVPEHENAFEYKTTRKRPASPS